MTSEQLPLFRKRRARPRVQDTSPAGTGEPLLASAPLSSAIPEFRDHMQRQGLSKYTIQAFCGDLNIFLRYVGPEITIGQVSTQMLTRFLDYLRFERGVPCKPKSFQRRLTSLKVFFAWLKKIQAIADDPAAPIVHRPASTPLPDVLLDGQVKRLVETARQARSGRRPDARPYLLVTLLLATGIKKSEAMALRLKDIDLSDPAHGVLFIRYEDIRKQRKERKLRLPPDFQQVLDEYCGQYHPQDRLFECTARNLEYVLTDLAKLTDLGDTVSFEGLRWTCALQDAKQGVPEDYIRQKLGLSPITWEEAGEKLRRLASQPL